MKVFVNTIIQYCNENKSIRLTGTPIFFTKLIFDQVAELTDHKCNFARTCYGSLANLSLLTTT